MPQWGKVMMPVVSKDLGWTHVSRKKKKKSSRTRRETIDSCQEILIREGKSARKSMVVWNQHLNYS